MKNLFTALLCLLSWSSIAQLSFQGKPTTALSTEKAIFEAELNDYEVVQFEAHDLVQHLKKATTTTSVNLALGSHNWDLTLNEYQLFAPDGHFLMDDIDLNQVKTFQGYVDGHPERFARIVVIEDYMVGVIHDGINQYEIVPTKRFLPQQNQKGQYLIYRSADQRSENSSCNDFRSSQNIKEEAQAKQMASCPGMNINFNTQTLNSTCQQIQLIIDIDPFFISSTGGGLSTFFAWIVPLLTAEGFYATEFNISFLLTSINNYTTATNPYPTTFPGFGGAFNTVIASVWAGNTTIPRDAIILFTGFGTCSIASGEASGIGDFCTVTDPNFWVASCGLMGGVVVAHELGHLLNAAHPAENCGAFPPNPCNFVPRPLMCPGSCSPTLTFNNDPGSYTAINDHLNNSQTCLSRPSATITGPDVLCPPHTSPATFGVTWAGNGTFIVPNASWTAGPGLSLTGPGNILNGVDFNVDPLYSGTTWVKVTFTSNGCTYAYQRNVVVNPSVQLSVQTQDLIPQCTNNNDFFLDMCPPDKINITAFLPGIPSATFSFTCSGGVSCSTSGSNGLSVSVPSGVSSFGLVVTTANQENCSNGRTFVFLESSNCPNYPLWEQIPQQEQAFQTPAPSNDLKLFPNPLASKAELQIELPPSELPYTLHLMDMQGRVLKTVQTTDQVSAWSMDDWTPGVYWVQATSNDVSLVKKLVISD